MRTTGKSYVVYYFAVAAMLVACASQLPTIPAPAEVKATQSIPADATIQILGYKCVNGAVVELRLDATGETTKTIRWDNAKQCGPGT